MKIYKLYILFVFGICCFSCNNDADVINDGDITGENPTELLVSTTVSPEPGSTKSTISSFPKDSELGLFISHIGDINDIYRVYGDGKNIRSTYDGYTWQQDPTVLLGTQPANVYAYYPYNENSTNPRMIPIEHTSQTDYMYSAHASNMQEVNKYNPAVTLTMNHALSLVQFNISAIHHPAIQTVNSVEIGNNPPAFARFYSRGTMDIASGEIGFDETSGGTLRWESDVPVSGVARINILVMPLPEPVTATGSLKVDFSIDGETYTWQVPAGTRWVSGTRYTYNMQLTGTELHVEEVVIEDWKPGTDQTYPLE